MDVLAIVRALKRHWRLTVPIAVLVAFVGGYVAFFTPASYEATASYVLFTPPAPPTPEEIAANPALGLVHADNAYARMDPAVVVDLVAKRVNNDATRSRLLAAGADGGYEVNAGGVFGVSSPTVDITGTGDSAARAITTAKLVGAEFERNLHELQVAQGTDENYMVKAVDIDPPTSATQKVSSRLRAVVAVLGLGALLLFVAVSIGEAFENMKKERTARRSKFVLPYTLDREEHAGRNGKRGGVEQPTPVSAPSVVLPNGSASPAPPASSTNGNGGPKQVPRS
jgi:hypothetical protein